MVKKEFTAAQVMALQEENRKHIEIVGEQFSSIQEKLSEHDKSFIDLEEKLTNRMDKGFARLENKVDKYFQKNETEHSNFQHRLQAAELK